MDQRELKRLVQLMNDNDLVELEIEREGERVHLRKSAPEALRALPMTYAALPGPAAAPASPQGNALPGAEPGSVAEERDPRVKEICSPMVGTFYRRPSPDEAPYADIGQQVTEDTVVCIVEAMKVNNEIKAEIDGEVLEVLVEDGQPVEFGQPLFLVRV